MTQGNNLKQKIRDQLTEKRNSLTDEVRTHLSEVVCEQLIVLVENLTPKTIHSFIPFGSEINILPFLQHCLDLDMTLVVPKIKKKPLMQKIQIDNLTDLITTKFGTKEPFSNLAFEGDLDLIIVPGLAFCKNGFRIGYGGGYYDYFLANQKNARKIAVGFPIQLMEELPHDPHDIPVDMLILGDLIIDSKTQRGLHKN